MGDIEEVWKEIREEIKKGNSEIFENYRLTVQACKDGWKLLREVCSREFIKTNARLMWEACGDGWKLTKEMFTWEFIRTNYLLTLEAGRDGLRIGYHTTKDLIIGMGRFSRNVCRKGWYHERAAKKYHFTGRAFDKVKYISEGDPQSIGFFGKSYVKHARYNRWVKAEKKFAKKGYRTLDLEELVKSDPNEILNKRNKNEDPVYYSNMYK